MKATRRKIAAAIGALMLCAVTLAAHDAVAASPGYGEGGYGTGMMRGYGPGVMGGYGAGMMGGYGPGMMGAYGPGMMGGGMMGGGMMSGPGMMSGYGLGFGHGWQRVLDLSDEQRRKLDAIDDELATARFDIAKRMRVQAASMREALSAEPRDRAAVEAAFRRMSDLRQEMFNAQLGARDKMEAVLTPEQRKSLRRFGPWWAGDD